MKTQDLMDQAQKIMTTYVCRDTDGEERLEMKRMVRRFFADHVSRLDKSEIMEHMATPMKALEWFNGYLCQTFWNRCCAGPIPESADTCQLA